MNSLEEKLRQQVKNVIRTLDENRYFVHDADLKIEKAKRERILPKVTTLTIINALIARGSLLLYGGYGGGKTQLVKILGRLLTGSSLEKIEEGMLRAHPQLTEEKMVARLDTGKLLEKGEEKVIWKQFIGSFWKVIDEVNRLSPHLQDILFSMLGEGRVKYFGKTTMAKEFVLYGTINPRDVGAFRMSRPFLDRFGLAVPVTMPGFTESARIVELDERLHEFTDESVPTFLSPKELKAIWELSSRIPLKEEAQFFISSLLKDFSLCTRVDKETGVFLERGEEICKGCHFSTKSAICNKIFTPLSVRAAKDLSRYSKALSWLLGIDAVPARIVATIAPYIIWHRITYSNRAVEEYIDQFKLTNELVDRALKNFSKRFNLFAEIKKLKRGQGDLKSIGLLREQSSGDLVINEDLYPSAKKYSNDTYRNLLKEYQKALKSENKDPKTVIREAREELSLQLLSKFNEAVREISEEQTKKTFKVRYSHWDGIAKQLKQEFPEFSKKISHLTNETLVERSRDGLHLKIHLCGRLERSPVFIEVYGYSKHLKKTQKKIANIIKSFPSED